MVPFPVQFYIDFQVCSENGEVVFIVVVLLEASGHSPSV